MSRNMLCLVALAVLVSFSSFSLAQNQTVKTARQQGGSQSGLNTALLTGCSNCFAYGGDLDPNSASANGLASEKDLIVSDAEVSWAVIVPPGHSATVEMIAANFLTAGCVADPQQADWDIRIGVSSGNGGTVIASGTDSIAIGPTGRIAFGLIECRVTLTLPQAMSLSAGTYFFGVVPYCTNSGNSTCSGQRFFLSDSTGKPPIGGKTYVPQNDSFFNSGFFGATWAPTWGLSGQCGGIGCNRFSAGLIGTPN